jgi:UDP-hydrolysing UDP-N-acetyl-D-glucosamine 2-epimerase
VARKIAVTTGTRADFGLLRNLLTEIEVHPALELQLIATGSHLSKTHGETIAEVEAAGFTPAALVSIWAEGSDALQAAIDTGEAMAKFGNTLDELAPDVVVVLGDRLEAFAMAAAATVLSIPVAHIHGGELTEGAMDDALRHSITKLSYLHFATTEEHAARIAQLGEDPKRIYNFGAPVLDVIAAFQPLSRAELEDRFGVKFGERNLMMTFHPAAFDVASAKDMIGELLSAMGELENVNLVITGTNNDIGSDDVRAAIAEFVAAHSDTTTYVESFGQHGYLSIMGEMNVVTGNSSSTVLEAPLMHVPSVLIGNRQEGRPMSPSILKPEVSRAAIRAALEQALTPEFSANAREVGTPFGKPGFAKKAAEVLATADIPNPPKKKFWQENK